ncbi:MAG: 3-deoxy-D-manno-octulosonic acid transferase [Pseudomonadota bacterium]
MAGGSWALSAYLALTSRAEGWGRRKLEKRATGGKEDPERLDERRGIASLPRPDGQLVWLHAASVGEALSLLEVIERLRKVKPDLQLLVTTGTLSSAKLLQARLPREAVHQFVPLDIMPFVVRFLDHWKPDLAIFTESEIWPCLITQIHARGIPLLLLNARLSETSLSRWRWLGGALSALLKRFTAIQAQDDTTAMALRRFGYPPERIAVTGTLKEGTPPPPCDEVERQSMTSALDGRPVWLAASTHPGEEVVAADAHAIARKSALRLLLIIAPRHVERGAEIATDLRQKGWRVAQRSASETLEADTQIYLADTLGEMGLWYRLAPISFVGGSLSTDGGHNPFEPAALGSAILHGPNVQNFRDIYTRLDMAGAARTAANAEALAHEVLTLLQPDRAAPMAYAAWEICSSGADVTDKALALILDHLPPDPEDSAQAAVAPGARG